MRALFLSLALFSACDPCTELDAAALEDPLTASEQSQADANGYFNLVGDCETDDLACEELLPDSCEAACAPGATCTQLSLTIEPCGRDLIFWDRDTGDHWIRKCLEIDGEDAGQSPETPSRLPTH